MKAVGQTVLSQFGLDPSQLKDLAGEVRDSFSLTENGKRIYVNSYGVGNEGFLQERINSEFDRLKRNQAVEFLNQAGRNVAQNVKFTGFGMNFDVKQHRMELNLRLYSSDNLTVGLGLEETSNLETRRLFEKIGATVNVKFSY